MSHGFERDKEHCRACMSVEELMERARKFVANKPKTMNTSAQDHPSKSNHSAKDENSSKKIRADCPLDTEQLGRSTWNLLHTMAAYFPDKPSDEERKNASTMMHLLGKLYPCSHCAEDLRKDLVKNPPNVTSREKFSIWMCGLHNRVNQKLGRPEFDCANWRQRWLDGWKDGSCEY